MYEQYWQLRTRPFDPNGDVGTYYPSDVHQGALLKLRYAIENHSPAALLAGGWGSGKTLIIRSLKRQLTEINQPVVHLVFPQMPATELLNYLAHELTGDAIVGGISETVRRIQRFLLDNAAAGKHAVVVVDEAHLLIEGGTLETLRLLLNFEHDGQPMFTLVLVGQPQLLVALERQPNLEQRLSVKCLLRALHLEETMGYVTHRLKAAGATREIFTPKALTLVHELTGGNPQCINRLCDLSLLVGFAEDRKQVGPEQVESVAGDLVLAKQG